MFTLRPDPVEEGREEIEARARDGGEAAEIFDRVLIALADDLHAREQVQDDQRRRRCECNTDRAMIRLAPPHGEAALSCRQAAPLPSRIGTPWTHATDLRLCRSLLFLPASNPRAIEKARGARRRHDHPRPRGCGAGRGQGAARDAAVAAAGEGFGGRPVAIRINPPEPASMARTWSRVRQARRRLCRARQGRGAEQVADAAWLMGKPVLAMIETRARGARRRRDRRRTPRA